MDKFFKNCLGIIIGMGFLMNTSFVHSQTTSFPEYKSQNLKLRKSYMWTLGGWAMANISGGLILRSQHSGSTRYFHEMNAIWNTVNLGIAIPAILSANKANLESINKIQALKSQHALERVLMLNIGLNTGYIATGAFLIERSNRRDTQIAPERLKGYGQSLILQGGFLLLFDIMQYVSHHRNGKKANASLWSMVNISNNGLRFTYKF